MNQRRQGEKRESFAAPADARPPNNTKDGPSYIVAIGGSAGGLEAFERFFAGIPPNTGMAFVVIQHLDPKHKALMPELLQRSIAMPVREIEDGVNVEQDHIYVIPPNTDLSISDGRLHLGVPSEAHGHRLPIDSFFRSLAAECGDKSIAVIVSGMGTDGTLGLKAIKEASGVVLVESPDSAKFDGMPRSAIGTGQVDYVVPIDELPIELMAYVNHVPRLRKEIARGDSQPPGALQKILRMLTTRTGHDFSLYKKSTLYRRIEKRASLHQIDGISEYAGYVEQSPEEMDALFRELLIGVTKFFRDPEAFEYLRDEVIPDLVKSAARGGSIRVWAPACSTGEEAYSLAILLRECLDRLRPSAGIKIQVFGTDIDERAIKVARKGLFPASIEADVPPERLRGFFTQTESGYVVKKLIRETVVFAPQDLATDPPFTKMDMVSCRNLLIYFSPELQRKVLAIFHYALNPNGILFLGTAEGVGSLEEMFSTIDSKRKLFRRKETPAVRTRLMEIPFRAPFVETPEFDHLEMDATTDVKEALWRTLLERYAPPSVVVTADGGITLISGRTGKYLEPAEGRVNWNVNAMAREGLRLELPGAIHRAVTHRTVVSLQGLNVRTNGDYQKVNVTVSPLVQPGASELFVVTFEDVAPPEAADTTVAGPSDERDERYVGLKTELAYTKERLQSTLEGMESTSEELKSANEELQSTNEELQSTNEELTTSKEELQSLNEELVTLNTELQSKVDDVTALNNDIVNLMNSAQVATIFLDNELRIKRFTPAVVGTFNLRSIDVGRPITDITQNLRYDTIEPDVRDVLDTLAIRELQVESNDGRWFIMRIVPYRTLDNVIDGVVITFSDITQLKDLEAALLKSESLGLALNVIHVAISSSLDFHEVMRAVVVKAAEAIGVELGMISMCEDGQWVVRYVSDEEKLPPGLRFTSEQAPYYALISETTEPTAINDTSADPGVCPEICEEFGMRSILGIPLISGRKLLGVLSLISTSSLINFTDADMDFAHKLGLAVSLALDNSRLYEAEHEAKLDAEVARQLLVEDHSMLQRALLPGEPHITSGYQLATRFVPGAIGKQVGGDFYDVFETEDGKTAILIGDVSGKGVESASMAAATRSTVRAFAYDLGDPAQALNHTNVVISKGPTYEHFATAFLAVLDPAMGRFTYSSAGHPPAMVRRAGGSVDLLDNGSFPIGITGDVEYTLHESHLADGDQLVVYTDGISEARKGQILFDMEGIQETLVKCRNRSPDDTLEALFAAALDFSGGHLADDAAVVIIERSKEKL
ncbi:MAG: SpoIIE family protein phosphatase [Armatimonadetes bacterium]|nr:SpoIIE family protein phosphatase [Armatimonadota bacterium]